MQRACPPQALQRGTRPGAPIAPARVPFLAAGEHRAPGPRRHCPSARLFWRASTTARLRACTGVPAISWRVPPLRFATSSGLPGPRPARLGPRDSGRQRRRPAARRRGPRSGRCGGCGLPAPAHRHVRHWGGCMRVRRHDTHHGSYRVESGTQNDVVTASPPGRHCPSMIALSSSGSPRLTS